MKILVENQHYLSEKFPTISSRIIESIYLKTFHVFLKIIKTPTLAGDKMKQRAILIEVFLCSSIGTLEFSGDVYYHVS